MPELVYRIEQGPLTALGARIFESYGFSGEDARILADSLVRADMRGIKSHGMVRVGSYIEQVLNGTFGTETRLEVVKETPGSLLIEANNALGFVASYRACEMTRKKAAACGMAWTVVRGSNHYGAAGLWASQLAGEDMIGFTSTNSIPIVAPPGGVGRGIGSNPLAWAVPAGRHGAVCLDVSMGVMAQGKIFEYKRLGKPLPENAWLGPDGELTTDPNKFDISEYIMVPFGGHKGYGLGVIMELISSQLAGGEFHRKFGGLTKEMPKTSHCFFAMRIDLFEDPAAYRERVDEYIDYLHGLPVRDGAPPVMFPGEIEARMEAESRERGVPLSAQVFDELLDIAKQRGLDTSDIHPVED